MDAIDRRIVSVLQRDGRTSITDLAAAVGLSPTPCARRLARLESDGVITGYGARVDQRALGLPVSVFIWVELETQSKEAVDAFERAIRGFDRVMECHLMTGTRDILMRVIAADLADFDRFLEDRLMRVPGIRSLRSSFALRSMVARAALPVA
ncbi:Lrp/AsnC family transcriptional regulator [Albidovulum sp.]|uniref:Lrp/AsnC family transcriptional regulator n=1 Tax=Albidovulum sp. TaxID=1872424 RepID=UPI001DC8A876|nr:Lrp/AsnC family transcriptional regulator [Paracoccaceae bacterium]MCC0047020.1 Lrp/AsnC family transcriptional regulator [Defluviimonas sp.]HPE24257.1 Lrp/AsnC family transcriptional regulator [Albidovulum sp.]MCB2118896.1 Lrp/AsnC family transcriptional regulator [Paracoccaceae bacterium]MCB2123855.1 Lrp/AsnC family transcriptional regulator [Paracoccaceae bacterium]